MAPIRVNSDLPPTLRSQIEWTWDLFCHHFHIPYYFEDSSEGDLLISTEEKQKGDISVSQKSQKVILGSILAHKDVFPQEPVIRDREGNKDILGTAFYMVNSLQERGASTDEFDGLGRFRYKASYQYRFEVAERDLVTELFEELYERLRHVLGEKSEEKPTRAFFTHDIDRIVQGNLREGYYRLKSGRIGGALKAGWNWILGKHEWNNIQEMIELHRTNGQGSTFFWLTERGRDEQGIINADYEISKKKYQDLVKKVHEKGSTNGLHKSTFANSYSTEFEKLPFAERINRDHYLKIRLPEHYQALEDEGFLLDSSLGFSERIGFRNSYGRPFHPYDERTGKSMRLLEVPLHVMDTTLFRNHKDPIRELDRFIDNAKMGSTLSFLWHNNGLTNDRFLHWKKAYLHLLEALKDRKVTSVQPEELLADQAQTGSEDSNSSRGRKNSENGKNG